mmetsp:Transcript_12150/g.33128  ORF Transcript_12150/g.33128 Transcript_12150/m.33128 type:complete len:208 (-) Transcript_12150:10-633(-)
MPPRRRVCWFSGRATREGAAVAELERCRRATQTVERALAGLLSTRCGLSGSAESIMRKASGRLVRIQGDTHQPAQCALLRRPHRQYKRLRAARLQRSSDLLRQPRLEHRRDRRLLRRCPLGDRAGQGGLQLQVVGAPEHEARRPLNNQKPRWPGMPRTSNKVNFMCMTGAASLARPLRRGIGGCESKSSPRNHVGAVYTTAPSSWWW